MGWSSGEELFTDVWSIVRVHIPREERQKLCRKIIDLFEDHDADTIFDNPVHPEVKAIRKVRYPDEETI